MKKLNLLIVLTLLLTSCLGDKFRFPSSDDHYDEILDKDGNIRKEYEGVYQIYNNFSDEEKRIFAKETLADFQKDNVLLPVPRILANDTYEDVKKGVRQRGRAIQMFLQDHYSGNKKYISDGVIPAPVIESILKRSGEDVWSGQLNESHISFWYGPDIIRDPQGTFKVVEDNPGFIGGMGDLIKARESLYKRAPEYQGVVDSPDPQAFYANLAEEYKKRAAKFGGIPVMVQYPESMAADNEDKRVKKIFEDLGIQTVTVDPDKKFDKNSPRLISSGDKLWYETVSDQGIRRRQQVGFVIANMETQDIDPTNELFKKKILMTEGSYYKLAPWQKRKLERLTNPVNGEVNLKKLEGYLVYGLGLRYLKNPKRGVPGLIDLYLKNKVGMSYSPGLEFIGDKEFYIYVDELVRYYLKEEPILSNMETGSFAKFEGRQATIDTQLYQRVFDNIDNYVIKGVDGRGGDAVWVGPKVSAEEISKVKELVKGNPSKFIFQKYTPLSIMDDHIVDLRIISDVGPEKVIVADVPWGRAVPMTGDGKVNISAQGSETTVLVRKNMNCHNMVLEFDR